MDVYKALVSLDPNKSPGNDLIGPNILKCGALSLYCPVHHLFTLCLSQHSIPMEWKIHKIIPVFKASNKSLVKSYRPISLLSTVFQVLVYSYGVLNVMVDDYFRNRNWEFDWPEMYWSCM